MTDEQIAIIKAIEEGIPLCEEPFAEIAQRLGMPTEQIIEQLRLWRENGTIRRFGAIINHRRAGFSANAMAVWNVPDNTIEEFAEIAVSYREVSHCYQRPRFADFNYNIYTMIHGKNREDCEAAAQKISMSTGIQSYRMLYTTAEFKKTSPVFFASASNQEGGR